MSNRDAAELHREIEQLRAELEHVVACSQNRDEENARLRSELAGVTAENERLSDCINKSESVTERGNLVGEIHALRARVAELEQIVAASLKAAPVGHIPTHTAERLPEIIADIATACSEQSEEREQAEARVAELVAALEKIAKADPLENGRYAAFRASAALARAESQSQTDPSLSEIRMNESATPAKHPDTEPEVIGGYEGTDGRRYWWTGGAWIYPGQEVAIIGARNQGGAE